MKIEEIVCNGGEDDQYIRFDDGSTLTSEHDRDCCEVVYADFRNMQVMMPQDKNFMWAQELDFYEDILNSIVKVPGMGFYIVTKQGICILVSCYNINNGYYSDNLALRHRGVELDITGCTLYDCYYDAPEAPEVAEDLSRNGFRATGEFEGVYRGQLQIIDMEIEACKRLREYIYGEGGYISRINECRRKARDKAKDGEKYLPPKTKINYILNTFPEACDRLIYTATSTLCRGANEIVCDWYSETWKKLMEERNAMQKTVRGEE